MRSLCFRTILSGPPETVSPSRLPMPSKADVYLWTAKRCGGGNADLETALAACNEVLKADVALLPNFCPICLNLVIKAMRR
mgnify:CR=1 FL=1